MSSQIFKTSIPIDILFSLLNDICVKMNHSYIIDMIAYKKGIYNEKIPHFISACKDYYHISKQKYVNRTLNYKTFLTIVRQICNHNKIEYKTKIKYDKSTYNIVYIIFIPNNIIS